MGIKSLPTKKGIHHSVQYSQKNGFTDNICILPPHPGAKRGGVIKFGNYRQYQQDAQVTEGFKSHVIWCDEELPAKMFETLIYRTIDYHGRLILTFTTLSGWTSLIQDYL
jgi:phage terminase large subunit-like protein